MAGATGGGARAVVEELVGGRPGAAARRAVESAIRDLGDLSPLELALFGLLGLFALALTLMSISALAQEPARPPSLEERVAKVEGGVGDAALAGHNAWMLTSSALPTLNTSPRAFGQCCNRTSASTASFTWQKQRV